MISQRFFNGFAKVGSRALDCSMSLHQQRFSMALQEPDNSVPREVFKNLPTNTSVSFKQRLFDDSAQSVVTLKHQWFIDDELWHHWMRSNKEWLEIGTTKQRRRLPEWLHPASPTRMCPLCASPHPPPRVCVRRRPPSPRRWSGRRDGGVWACGDVPHPSDPRSPAGGVVLTPWRWGQHTHTHTTGNTAYGVD